MESQAGVGPATSPSSNKRKRSEDGGIYSSPASNGADDLSSVHNGHTRRDSNKRLPGVKRACNECRQQKLRCDVVQDPFKSCTRCMRQNLQCKIESNFKRVGKRSRQVEIEREVEHMRAQLQRAQQQGFVVQSSPHTPVAQSHSQGHSPAGPSNRALGVGVRVGPTGYSHTRHPSLIGSDEAVSSLIHLKQGMPFSAPSYRLDTVQLTSDTVAQLFSDFFIYYHPFLPFLDPSQPPDAYMQQHVLLFWAIVSVAARRFVHQPDLSNQLNGPVNSLVWKVISEVPESYHVVKALCLLCAWPLPAKSPDPTHILCGVMIKVATGIGLHRPGHFDDFSGDLVELNKDQLHDRVVTWAVCNIVAQSTATGYGQPASTSYDWTHAVRPGDKGPFTLESELDCRLQIERFCDKVSKDMYGSAVDPRGVAGDEHRSILMRVYRREYMDLRSRIEMQAPSPLVLVYLKAAHLHLRLSSLFGSKETKGYQDDLMELWCAIVAFLEDVVNVDNPKISPSNISSMLQYCPSYIEQMVVAAGFALMKLLTSFFAKSIDFESGQRLFLCTTEALSNIGFSRDGLESRLASLMMTMWQHRQNEEHSVMSVRPEYALPPEPDDSLQLQVRCRHSMSVVYDSIWRWREGGRLLAEPTHYQPNPNMVSGPGAPANMSFGGPLMQAGPAAMQSDLSGTSNSMLTQGPAATSMGPGPTANILMPPNYGGSPTSPFNILDPHLWMLGSLVDLSFPAFIPPSMDGP